MVILLVLAVVSGMWWGNTRRMDFLTPPSAAKLEAIRIKVKSSLPRQDQRDDAISVPAVVKAPTPPPIVEEPEMDLGDLTTPPTLQSYGELSSRGAVHLIALAGGLEKKGEFQRALLAWERVVDLTPAEWNAQPEAKIAITLHAGTGRKLAATLTPILVDVARDLEAASSGILKVAATVTPGKTSTPVKGPTPVALWLAGPDKKSASTETLSFTVTEPETLRQDILKTVFQLIRSHLGRATKYIPPAALADGENPQGALNFRVTRLCWSEFAGALNLPPTKK